MEELGTPPKLMDERLGHEDSSVQARYSHVTPAMRRQLVAGLTQLWDAFLDARAGMSPHSPVSVLDELLKGTQGTGKDPRALLEAVRAGSPWEGNRP